jgi:hypothetical protein
VNPGADAPQSLESSLLSRLKQSLLQGTTIVQSDEDRHVERSLGCEWVLDWNEGTSQCRAVGEAHIGPWEKAAIGLTRPLQNPTWIRGWIASVDPQLGRQVRERIVKELWTRLQRSPELRTARWQLLAARFRIAQPIRLALRLWADLNPSTDDLFFLRSVRTVVEARGRENPRLLPLLGLVPRDEASVWSGDYRALRDYLTTRGLREAGWKLLCRHGRRLWQGAVGSARHLDDPLVMIIAIANALAIAGERRVPPPDVVHAIVDAEGLIVAGQELKRLVPAKLLAAATRQWRSLQGKPARRAFARTDVAQVIDWWQQTDQEESDVPPRARWGWYSRRAHAWRAEQVARRRAEDQCWDFGLPDAVIDSHQVVPLRSAMSLWREAQAMRNCLGEPEYSTKSGRQAYALVSIRRPGRQRPLATFAAHWLGASVPGVPKGSGRWALGDLRGFANRPGSDALAQVAERYLAQANLAHPDNHRPTRHPEPRRRGRSPDLRLHFLGHRGRMLFFDLIAGKDVVTLRISDALDSLNSILRWLEAVASGVTTCAAYTDGEGLYRELRFTGVGDDGMFRVIDGEDQPVVVGLSRTDLVATIYAGFRGMLGSSMDESIEWESGNLWDRLESCLTLRPTRAILAHQLSNFSRARLNAILGILERMGGAGRDEVHDRAVVLALLGIDGEASDADGDDARAALGQGFDDWPSAMRIEALDAALRCAPHDGTGTRLHWQRSRFVEVWLAASSVDLQRWIDEARDACDREVASGLVELAQRDRYGLRMDPAMSGQNADDQATGGE